MATASIFGLALPDGESLVADRAFALRPLAAELMIQAPGLHALLAARPLE